MIGTDRVETLLDRVIAKSGLSESSVCQLVLRQNNEFRKRLRAGTMSIRTMAKAEAVLVSWLLERGEPTD